MIIKAHWDIIDKQCLRNDTCVVVVSDEEKKKVWTVIMRGFSAKS